MGRATEQRIRGESWTATPFTIFRSLLFYLFIFRIGCIAFQAKYSDDITLSLFEMVQNERVAGALDHLFFTKSFLFFFLLFLNNELLNFVTKSNQ